MAILDDVKLALRISHNVLNTELTANIAEARAEMVRNGISETIAADETNPLIVGAIKTYVKMVNADDDKTADRYNESWKYQLDCLRKSTLEEPNTDNSDSGSGGDGE